MASLFLLLWPSTGLWSLPPERAITQFTNRGWSTADGLPQNAITALAGGSQGYLWIGTQEGLARFDGVRLTTFHQHNTAALADHFISALEVAADGSLWIGTRKGLVRYRDGAFERFSEDLGLPHEYIRSLHSARDGTLWVGTYGGGLARWRGDRFEDLGESSGLPADAVVRQLLEDVEGILWVGTLHGLYRRDGDGFAAARDAGERLRDAVRSLTQGVDGSLWVAMESGSLLRLHDGEVEEISLQERGVVSPLTALHGDRHGNLWIGTEGEGILRYRQGIVDRLIPGEGQAHAVVWSFLEDSEGSLWVGTRGGLIQLTAGPVTSFSSAEGLTHDFVRTVFEDRQGLLWIGTEGGLFHLEDGRVRRSPISDRLPSNRIRAFAEGSAGELWVGTRDGVHRVRDRSVSTWDVKDGLPSSDVNALVAGGSGELWIGTSAGLARLESGRIRRQPLEGLKDPLVRSLGLFRGALWVGTESGLVRLGGEGQEHWGTEDGLPSDFIYALHEEDAGALWIGTSGGLARFENGNIESFTVEHGLVSNLIFQILEDEAGYLWLSSNRGIFRVSKAQLQQAREDRAEPVRALWLDEADGMTSSECNGGSQPAGTKTTDGRLWFPTLRGAAVLDPNRLDLLEAPPAVLIEDLASDGVSLGAASVVDLAPGQRLMGIRYTAPTFRSSHKIRFRYRLLGYTDEWIDAGTRREAFFTGLRPGRFRFQVAASRGDGTWSSRPAELEILLRPFFYQTRWFLFLVGTFGLLLLWLFLRFRLRSSAARQAELLALVTERTSQLESANRKLERLAALDPLTNIANQRQFRRILRQEWRRAARSKQPVGLLLLDIDFFKDFNDTYGHLAGDSCLVKVAQALRDSLGRAGDTFARYGGEEFAAILPRTDLKAALQLAERVRRSIEALGIEHRASPVAPVVTVSVGVASSTPAQDAPDSAMDSLISEADQALYRAKGSGRNQVR